MRSTELAYVILGSNLDDPVKQITLALESIANLPHTIMIKKSSYHISPFVGQANQPDVYNVAVKIQTSLSAQELLRELLAIEDKQGRVREEGIKTSRTLDCDLLLFGEHIIDEENIKVPHPEMTNRSFVLIPLLEIEPDLKLPNGKLLTAVCS